MKLTNAGIVEVNAVLQAIANRPVESGGGSARLKWAANYNRTLLKDALSTLDDIRTVPIEGEAAWEERRKQMILEECIRHPETNDPIVVKGQYQFHDSAAFQAKVDHIQRSEFPDMLFSQQQRDKAYTKLLVEEVELATFPYVIKWDFIEFGPARELLGITGEEQFVLMSKGLLVGEPAWLNEPSINQDGEV